jgi:hypothetical protein
VPAARRAALVAVQPDYRVGHAYAVGWLTAPHRLTCPGCSHVTEWVPRLWRTVLEVPLQRSQTRSCCRGSPGHDRRFNVNGKIFLAVNAYAEVILYHAIDSTISTNAGDSRFELIWCST